MRPFTLDNHLTFGYGDGAFNPEQKGSNALWCRYSRCSREPGTFPEECVRTAMLLGDQAAELGRPPVLMLSGGLDSEVVAKSFMAAGVDFHAITYRFANGKNAHETRFVDKFVKRHGIRHTYYDVDVDVWARSEEAHALFHGAQAASMNLVPHMKLMSHIWFELNGMPVLGNGDMYLENGENGWNYVELEYMLSWFRHAIKHKILGGIAFFQHTPEITLSMVRHPKIERLGRNQDAYASRVYETSKFIKYGIYRQFWPDLEMRPKFGGQEMVSELFTELGKKWITERDDPFNDRFIVPYDELRAMLEPNA